MKKRLSLILLIGVVMLLFCSCVTCPPKLCPNQDIVVRANTPFGESLFIIEKGGFDENEHGKTWITVEEFKEKLRIKKFKKERL